MTVCLSLHETIARNQPAVLLGHSPWHQAADDDDRLLLVHRVLVVQDGEAQAPLALNQLDDEHLLRPHRQVRQRLQRSRLELRRLLDGNSIESNE